MNDEFSLRQLLLRPVPEPNFTDSKYVFFPVKYGFNNCLQALQIALLLSLVTKRTLIVNDFPSSHAAAKTGLLSQRIQAGNLFQIQWPIKSVTDVRMGSMSSTLVAIETSSSCGVDLRNVVRRYRSEPAQVLVYDNSWGFWQRLFKRKDHALISKALSTHLDFLPRFHRAALLLQAWLPRHHAAAHIRLGDIRTFPLVNCSSAATSLHTPGLKEMLLRGSSYDKTFFETMSYGLCVRIRPGGCTHVVTYEQVLPGFVRNSSGRSLFISTNQPGAWMIWRVRQILRKLGLRVFTWQHFPKTLRLQALQIAQGRQEGNVTNGQEDAFLVSILEQLLCIYADEFLPSYSSSWSEIVVQHRHSQRRKGAAAQSQMLSERLNLGCPQPRTTSQ